MSDTFNPNKPPQQPRGPEGKERLKLKFLFADDGPLEQMLNVAILQSMGHEVVMVKNGQELLDKLESGEAFDIVLTDIQMPEIDGVTALQKIRENPKFASLPVIVYSATWETKLEEKVDMLGGKRLKKPLKKEELEKILIEVF
jgi:two-component system, sensor histidine kinase and response regulator